ncbi:MAG: PEP-CTERM sorting domain-containing protein [Akkermansia sp.]
MKRNLFIAAVLGILAAQSSMGAYDAMRPKEIITVSTGTETFTGNLGTENADKSETVIVKDGQGTLVVNQDAAMLYSLVVREGTMQLTNCNITNDTYRDGPNLTIGGVNACLELDNATYKQTGPTSTGRGYSNSLVVGGQDGDGKLVLKNSSELYVYHCLFAGSISYATLPQDSNTSGHVCGTYQGVEGDTLYREYSIANGGFQQAVDSNGNTLSTASIDLQGGSKLNLGMGMNLGNVSVSVDGPGTELNSALVQSSNMTTWGFSGDKHSITKVSITNGGVMRIGGHEYTTSEGATAKTTQTVLAAYQDNTHVDIKIDGEGSACEINGQLWVASHSSITNAQAELTISNGGTLYATGMTLFGYYGSQATVSLDNDATLKTDSSLYIGTGTTLTACNNSTIRGNAVNIKGGSVSIQGISCIEGDEQIYIYNGANVITNNNSFLKSAAVYLNSANTSLTNNSGIVATESIAIYGGASLTIDDTSTLTTKYCGIDSGSPVVNHGTIQYSGEDGETGTIVLYGGAEFQTGSASISGRTAQEITTPPEMTIDLQTGLSSMNAVYGATYDSEAADDSGVITLGTLLVGKDNMQYLSQTDLDSINTALRNGIGLTSGHENYTFSYRHEIGENITLGLSTDQLNKETGSENIALSGGGMTVKQGDDECTVGTIGTYVNNSKETEARVALQEGSSSTLEWKGAALETISHETSRLSAGSSIKVTPESDDGVLRVVSNSVLSNDGNVTVSLVDVLGTFSGSGTVAGKVQIQNGGQLVVGNSPGCPSYESLELQEGSTTVFSVAGLNTPSTGSNVGWASDTYSQITLTSGTLTIQDGAKIVIALGGNMLDINLLHTSQDFSLTLITGGTGYEALSSDVLATLLQNTTFTLTDETEGLFNPDIVSDWSITVNNAVYSVSGNTLVLSGSLTIVPEPSTAILALISLFGTAYRRRRRSVQH